MYIPDLNKFAYIQAQVRTFDINSFVMSCHPDVCQFIDAVGAKINVH